jgi:hypothetical protein
MPLSISFPEWFSRSDFVGATLGALLGFLGGYFMFWLERRKEKRSTAAKRRAQFEEVALIFKRALRGWENAITKYKEKAQEYQTEPYALKSYWVQRNTAQITLAQLNRLDVLDSYRDALGVNGRDAWAKTFFFLDSMIEHQTLRENGVLSMLKEFTSLTRSFQEISFEIAYNITDLMYTLGIAGEQNTALYVELDKLRQSLNNMGSTGNIQDIHKVIYDPLGDLLKNAPHPERIRLFSLRARLHTQYLSIKAASLDISNNTSVYADQITELLSNIHELVRVLDTGLPSAPTTLPPQQFSEVKREQRV